MRRPAGGTVRSAREVAASLRDAPFRAALVLSAVLHLLLFVGVRLGPMPAFRPAPPAMRLQIIRVMPEGEVAAVAAPPPSPMPARVAPDSPGTRGGVDPRPIVKTGPAPIPAATAAVPAVPVDPAVPTDPADPAEGAGLIPAGPVVETLPPAEAPADKPQVPPASESDATAAPAPVATSVPVASASSGGGSDAEIPLGPAVPKGEEGGLDGPGSLPPAGAKIAAAGVGPVIEPAAAPGVSGDRSAAGRSGSDGSGAPASLADLRRRIDARKVYPQIAVRNGWEGRVLVEMRLADDGRLAGLRLLEGSGYAVLDEATLAAVRRAAPYPPVAGPVTVPVEYRLTP